MAGKPLKDALRPLRRALPSARPAAVPAPVVVPEPVFAELFADARPLKPDQRYPHRPAPPPHWPRHSAAHHASTTPSSHGQITDSMVGWFEPATLDASFVRPGMQRHTLKKLRQGYWPQVAELDLHGLSRFDAQQHLAVLLHRARQLGQCVRVIHGKGLGSREGLPVLKQVIRTWLRHHPHVLAFCEADEARGGAGALLVLLRREG